MVRPLFVIVMMSFTTPVLASGNADPDISVPVDRGYGQHDACFGDKYESDDDLKTGNEQEVEEILKMLLKPGS